MKIALVARLSPTEGPLNEHTIRLINELSKLKDVETIVICAEKRPPHTTDETAWFDKLFSNKVIVQRVWQVDHPLTAFQISRALKSLNADVVLFNLLFTIFGQNPIWGALGLLSPLFSRLTGNTVVVLLHHLVEAIDLKVGGYVQNPVYEWLIRAGGKLLTYQLLVTNAIIVTLHQNKRILEEQYGVRSGKIFHVPHGNYYAMDTQEKIQQISEPINVLTFGKFGTYKRLDDLISAHQIVQNKGWFQSELFVAGSDHPSALGYIDSIQQEVQHLSGIHFLSYIPEEKIGHTFKNADLVVLPYHTTTGAISTLIFCATFCRLPYLADSPDVRKVVYDDNYQAIFYDKDSPLDLAEKILDYYQNPTKYEAIISHNYEVSQRTPFDLVVKEYVKIFKGLTE